MKESTGFCSDPGNLPCLRDGNINFWVLKGKKFGIAVWMDEFGNFENFMDSGRGEDARLVCLFFVRFFKI
jgi:hypothetical protein